MRATKITWWLGLGAAAVAAGMGAQATRLPGGWLIGPLIVAIFVGLARPEHPKVSGGALRVAQAVIGMLLASTFRPSVLPLMAAHWLPVLLVVSATLLFSLGAGIVLARISSLDRETAAMGTLPGGASGMISMSVALGADTRMVALMQYVRLVLVVVSAALLARFALHPAHAQSAAAATPHISWIVSFWTFTLAAAGSSAGARLRMPAGALLGPLIVGIVVVGFGWLHPVWPPGVTQAAYVVLGLYVGLLFDRESLRQAGRLLPLMLLSTLALMALCAGLAWALAGMTGADYLTSYLATTPGGLDSITVVALGSGADVSLILAVQMIRILAIVFTGPLLTQQLLRKR